MTKTEINNNLIFLMKTGSQAYGTTTPESDIDYGGVCMPSINVLLGIDEFDQDNKWVDDFGQKVDKIIYSVNKAINLLMENNPNMMDYLCSPEHAVIYRHDLWKKVQDNAHLFISKKTYKSYLGYATSQLNRIETHRKYLLNPPTLKSRNDFGLPEHTVFPETQYKTIMRIASEFIDPSNQDEFRKEMEYMLDTNGAFIIKRFVGANSLQDAIEMFKTRQDQYLRMIGSLSTHLLADEYKNIAKTELSYMNNVRDYERYLEWDRDRNEKRKELERKCGYDAKHASHCIRLTRMALEIMEGKGINVDRRLIDADELLDIRLGNWTYQQVIDLAKDLQNKAHIAAKNCDLIDVPDRDAVINLQKNIMTEYYNI